MKAQYLITIYPDRFEVTSNFVENTADECANGDYKSLAEAKAAVQQTGEGFRIFDALNQKYIK